MLRASPTGRLVCLGAHPLHQTRFIKCANPHQHATHSAVAANPIVAAAGKCLLNDGHIDRVQDNDRIGFHAQSGGRINPVAIPPRCTQFRKDFTGVVTPLRADDNVAFFQRFNIKGVL